MKIYLILVTCFLTSLLQAQSQWASEVISVSSTLSNRSKQQYAPEQVLGKPDRLPFPGNATNAWSPASDDGGVEYIHVAFSKAQIIQQIAIAENNAPGAITKITVFDSLNKSAVVYENPNPSATGELGRMFYAFFQPTVFKVKSVKVELNTAAVPGSNQIDAIGISSAKDSLKAQINLAQQPKENPKIENLGTAINSKTDDLCPVISPDGKTLYYTRQGHPENIPPVTNQDIWQAAINPDNTFSPAVNIGAPLNNKDNSSLCSITPDGQRALLLNVYHPDGSMEKGVSIVQKDGQNWGFPQKVNIPNFYNDNMYGEYCLSNSGKVLLMTLERKDSEGSKDIYVSFQNDAGEWSEPLHTGNVINTPESEASPFLSADERTLYFATRGFSGYGKNDFYMTRRLDESWTKWSEPQNLGPFINTPEWEGYLSIPASGNFAYFVSYSNSMGASDIFRISLPDNLRPTPVTLLSGRVLHKRTNEPLHAKITYKNLTTGKTFGEAFSDSISGSFMVSLPAGFKYAVYAEKDDFYPQTEVIDLTKLKSYQEVSKTLLMEPLTVGSTARLNNVFFDFNKASLKQESMVELNILIQLMQSKPGMKVTIQGHTDDVGDNAYNLDLSKKRAKTVRDYLISKGIAADRILSEGYGETRPVQKGTDEISRQMNRRVEFEILAL